MNHPFLQQLLCNGSYNTRIPSFCQSWQKKAAEKCSRDRIHGLSIHDEKRGSGLEHDSRSLFEKQQSRRRTPGLLCVCGFGSDDACRDQNDQQDRDQSPLCDQECLSFLRLQIRHIIAGQEERNVGGNEYGNHAPPSVYPDERVVAGACEKRLDQSKQQRHFQCDCQLAADPVFPEPAHQIPFGAVLGHHPEGYDASQGKHHGKLPADANEQNEGRGLIADRPQRVSEDFADDRIADFIQPVHAVQSEAGIDGFIVLLVDFGPVDIEHNGQNENERPVEVFRTADPNGVDQVHGLLGTISPESEHVNTSLLY